MLTLQRWWRRRRLRMLQLLVVWTVALLPLLLPLPQHAQAFQPHTPSLGSIAAARARAPMAASASVVLRAAATAQDWDEEEGGEEGEASLWWRPAVPTVRTCVRAHIDACTPQSQIPLPTHRHHHIDPQTRFAARVAYDGTRFNGWQYQVKSRTVQLEVERALNATIPVRRYPWV